MHTQANLELTALPAKAFAKPDDAELSTQIAAQKKVCDNTWEPVAANYAQQFNNRLDAAVAGTFLVLVTGIILLSVRE